MADNPIKEALCQMLEKALLDSGLNPVYAKAVSKAGCEKLIDPTVGKATDIVIAAGSKIKEKVTRKKTANDRKQSKALREANLKLRNKNGKLKKGKTQGDVMKLAHRIRRKMK